MFSSLVPLKWNFLQLLKCIYGNQEKCANRTQMGILPTIVTAQKCSSISQVSVKSQYFVSKVFEGSLIKEQGSIEVYLFHRKYSGTFPDLICLLSLA